jgi:hypothetical protein
MSYFIDIHPSRRNLVDECEIIDRHIGPLIFGKGNVTACQKCFQNMYQRKEIMMDIDGNKWRFIKDVESQRKF